MQRAGDRPLRRSLTHTPPTAAQSKASTRAATCPKARPDRLGLRLHKRNGRPTNAPTLLLHQPFSSSSGSGWRTRPPTRSTGPANERSSQPGCDAGLACLTTDCPFAEAAICCWSSMSIPAVWVPKRSKGARRRSVYLRKACRDRSVFGIGRTRTLKLGYYILESCHCVSNFSPPIREACNTCRQGTRFGHINLRHQVGTGTVVARKKCVSLDSR